MIMFLEMNAKVVTSPLEAFSLFLIPNSTY